MYMMSTPPDSVYAGHSLAEYIHNEQVYVTYTPKENESMRGMHKDLDAYARVAHVLEDNVCTYAKIKAFYR